MNAFHVLGGVLALWALVVTALGLMRHDFPGSKAGERLVAVISVVLVAGAIGSGIVTAANESHGGEAEAHGASEEPAGGAPAVEEPTAQEPPADEPAGEPAAGGDTPTAALSLTADAGGGLSYDTDALEAEAGEVTIVMENPSSVPHDVAIEGDGVDEKGEVVGEGETSQVSAELAPGEYTFYCSVPGHRQAGMEGTLTVSG